MTTLRDKASEPNPQLDCSDPDSGNVSQRLGLIAPVIQVNSEEASLETIGEKDPKEYPGKIIQKEELTFLPRAISNDLLKSELAVMSGGVDKKGNYVIVFPTKRHSVLSTQYAFADHLQILVSFLVDLVMLTNPAKTKFSFVVDQNKLNHTAISVIIRTLTAIQKERKCIDILYVARPKEKKEFKTLQKLLGLGKSKSRSDSMPKLNFAAVMLNDPREVQKFIDPANLPRQQGGYHPYQHDDFVNFIFRLERLRDRSEANLNKFDDVREETIQFHKQTKTSRSGLRRSTKVISSYTERLTEKLDLDSLIEECDNFLNDLVNPEREGVYAQIPRALLLPVAVREIEFHKTTLMNMKAEMGQLQGKNSKRKTSASGSTVDSQCQPVDEKEENKRCGLELLTWLKTVGPDTLEQSMKKLGEGEDCLSNIDIFHEEVVPYITEALEIAEEWAEFADSKCEVEAELKQEMGKELEPLKKHFVQVQRHYKGCEKFYANVKTVMNWYQDVLAVFPPALLNEEGRPDGKKLRVYEDIGQKQRSDLQRIQKTIEPLNSSAIHAIETNMVFVDDTALRNQSKILVQRCKLLEKLLEIYGQHPDSARREILSRRSALKSAKNLHSSLPPTLQRSILSDHGDSVDCEASPVYEALTEDAISTNGKIDDAITPSIPPRMPLLNGQAYRRTQSSAPTYSSNSLPQNGTYLMPTRGKPSSHQASSQGKKSLFSRNTKPKPKPNHSSRPHRNEFHKSKTVTPIVSDSQTLEMNFSSPRDELNYGGNPFRNTAGSNFEIKKLRNSSAHDIFNSEKLSQSNPRVASSCRLGILSRPGMSSGVYHLPINESTDLGRFEHDCKNSASSDVIRRRISRNDFYTLSDYQFPGAMKQRDDKRREKLRSLLWDQSIAPYYSDEMGIDEKYSPKIDGTNQYHTIRSELPRRDPEIDPWDDVETLKNRRLLQGLTKQLVTHAIVLADEESELSKERERVLRLEILEEEIRQVDIKNKLIRARKMIEKQQLIKRKQQVYESLKQREFEAKRKHLRPLETEEESNHILKEEKSPNPKEGQQSSSRGSRKSNQSESTQNESSLKVRESNEVSEVRETSKAEDLETDESDRESKSVSSDLENDSHSVGADYSRLLSKDHKDHEQENACDIQERN